MPPINGRLVSLTANGEEVKLSPHPIQEAYFNFSELERCMARYAFVSEELRRQPCVPVSLSDIPPHVFQAQILNYPASPMPYVAQNKSTHSGEDEIDDPINGYANTHTLARDTSTTHLRRVFKDVKDIKGSKISRFGPRNLAAVKDVAATDPFICVAYIPSGEVIPPSLLRGYRESISISRAFLQAIDTRLTIREFKFTVTTIIARDETVYNDFVYADEVCRKAELETSEQVLTVVKALLRKYLRSGYGI